MLESKTSFTMEIEISPQCPLFRLQISWTLLKHLAAWKLECRREGRSTCKAVGSTNMYSIFSACNWWDHNHHMRTGKTWNGIQTMFPMLLAAYIEFITDWKQGIGFSHLACKLTSFVYCLTVNLRLETIYSSIVLRVHLDIFHAKD